MTAGKATAWVVPSRQDFKACDLRGTSKDTINSFRSISNLKGGLICSPDCDEIVAANDAGLKDFGHDALAIIFHQGAQTIADGVHLMARRPAFVEEQNSLADFNLLADEFNELDALGFDIGPDDARWDGLQSQAGGVLGDLFTFDQGDLAAARLAGSAADLAEITRLPTNALAGDDFDFVDGLQRCAGFGWVKVEGSHAGG